MGLHCQFSQIPNSIKSVLITALAESNKACRKTCNLNKLIYTYVQLISGFGRCYFHLYHREKDGENHLSTVNKQF